MTEAIYNKNELSLYIKSKSNKPTEIILRQLDKLISRLNKHHKYKDYGFTINFGYPGEDFLEERLTIRLKGVKKNKQHNLS